MWLHTVGLTLLLFIISTGFGLFILMLASNRLIEASRLSRLETLILGFTIGAPGSGTFLQLFCVVERNLKVDLAVLSLTSLVGFIATHRLWRPRRQDLREIALWTAIAVPFATMTWWCSFGAFSNFPFTDIGADVHWMKIAQEFADTGVLNPYANQTYSDLRAALAGLLSGTFGLDLVQFHWTYRYLSSLCLGIFFYAVASSLFVDSNRKWFAVFFAISTNTLGILTNGSLALASSLVFLTTLMRTARPAEIRRIFPSSTIAPAMAAFAGAVVAFLLNNNALLLATLPVLFLCLNALCRLGRDMGQRIAPILLVSAAWPMALIFVHRSSYLFVLIAIASWLLYLVVLKVVSQPAPRRLKSLWVASLLLPSLCVLILLYVAAARVGFVPKVSANGLFSLVTQVLLGRAMSEGDEIMLGAGPEVAAIEFGRAIGPLFAVMIGVMYLWWSLKNPPSRIIRTAADPDQSGSIARLLWSWVAACGFSLAVLSGFPFMYRILFFVLELFTIATTEIFCQLLIDSAPSRVGRLRLVSGLALILIAALTIGVYSFSWWPDLPYSAYQIMLRPAQMGALAVTALCAALTLSGRRRVQILAAATVIGLSVAMDRSAIMNLFRVYSYGRPPDGAAIITHYDASDLATDRWLHDNLPNSVVVTDPLTLAMAKAVGGLPGLYLFSNLDTVHPIIANDVKEIIAAIVRPEQDKNRTAMRTCATMAPLLSNLNLEARAQMGTWGLKEGMLKSVRPSQQLPIEPLKKEISPLEPSTQEETGSAAPQSERENLINNANNVLQTPHGQWNLIAIINPRTMSWLQLSGGQRLSYFPINAPLDPEVLNGLRRGPFMLPFSDGQNVVVVISCTDLQR
ncbi:hypothetical protein [Bradyrhizobium iriomotense]|uniref:GtrA-like protein domain-containing protein n=1 Tax=Bradyrhizobium iriomotense TaxID=441950 RepID=A0ABQ6ATB3_9BRAD|nr:hypothetical protein [Bradyrhizobium iriomotense]GLR85477.1 hypothetical protein GCM10007857_21880 [Bradyrhizobium iriomotense]